ncbi:Eukaryotic translation initiation factor 3 subunit H [Cladochytrium tenue]|nr:Eukaryotic translation initiation factor 3 subunit H [Cladochytrium tenue]
MASFAAQVAASAAAAAAPAKEAEVQNAAPSAAALTARDPDYEVDLAGIDPAKLQSQPLREVQLDSLVVLKIIKHCRDKYPGTAYGQLLGVDVAGVLEVTHCFPVTSKSLEDDGEPSVGAADEMDGAEYQLRMLRCLRKMNYDASSVGLYVSTNLGSFWNQTIIENQFSYQRTYSQSVLLVYDPTRTSQGNLNLRALRLSDTFMSIFKEKKFSMEAMHAHNLTAATIFETLPVKVRNSGLTNVFLRQAEALSSAPLDAARFPASSFDVFSDSLLSSADGASQLTPNFDTLDLGSEAYLERHLEYLTETVEEYGQEQWRWQGWQRSLTREQQRSAQTAARKRLENAARTAAGQSPLYTDEDIDAPSPALAKILASEPSRLDTLVITNQIDTYCKQINQFAGPGLTKMYLAKAIARSK